MSMDFPTKIKMAISIHALREEGDDYKNNRCICAVAFQSTPSARRATRFCACCIK